MESGLEGRNNISSSSALHGAESVSMESGLEGRNNLTPPSKKEDEEEGLNGVRPRRPEQSTCSPGWTRRHVVSMESGLEGRNNAWVSPPPSRSRKIVSMESGLEGRNN